jgi:hypothetical protein
MKMANNVNIILGPSGLGRPLPGEDHISGLIYYTAHLPSGFDNYGDVHEIFSVEEAETLGIDDNHSGETRAIGTTTITATGSTGAVFTIGVATNSGTVNIGSYTVVSTDSKNTIASSLVADINTNTSVHGYTATASTATISVTAPGGTGLNGNSFTFDNTVTGSGTTSATTFAGGVASWNDPIHYHISEYFRMNPKGDLFVMIQSATTTFSEIVDLQNAADGKVRQVGVYTQSGFATADVSKIQTQLDTCFNNYKPLEAIYQADFSTVTDLTTLSDLHQLTAKNVSVLLGQDGANKGEELWLAVQKSIGTVGAALGTISASKVSESIAWVGKFDVSDVELETLAFANGAFYSSLSDGLKNAIENKGYIFLKKYVGYPGSYFNNPYTCVASSSDYSRINLNRTINKAGREVRTFLLPAIASPVFFLADGTLTTDVCSYFETQAARALDQMVRDGELSAFKTLVNPTQNVLSTNKLVINVSLVPVGTADVIDVNVGFVLSV